MSSPDTRIQKPGALLPLVAVALAAALYFAGASANPPGFYIDESSVAYNAHLIAETGRDEHGEPLPLYFHAFGEYKNAPYIYLLAAVFKVTGPSVAAARHLSAALGVAAALALGWLALRLTRRPDVGAAVALSALLTPWLFEAARLVFEAAAFPFAVVLTLLAVRRAALKERWSWADAALVAAGLALVTYTYTVGRALGPLLAVGLALFYTRARRGGLLKAWALYALSLVPLFVFALRRPDALTTRFNLLTYVGPESGALETAARFARQYLLNLNPWRLLLTGEENVRDHVPGAGALLAATALLAAASLALLWRGRRFDAWWRFVVFGLFASVVPASLTVTEFPQLRLLAFPVFLHTLTAPAWAWLLGAGVKRDAGNAHTDEDDTTSFQPTTTSGRPTTTSGRPTTTSVSARPRSRRALAAAVVLLVVAQGLYFQWLFRRDPVARGYVFDDRFARKVLAPALATGRAPIYLADPPGRAGYIQALWHGLLAGAERTRFRRLAPHEQPPPGAVVISTADSCAPCRLLVRHLGYIVYAVPPTDLRPRAAPLPLAAFRAELRLNAAPLVFRAGEAAEINVTVRHAGSAPWPAVGEEDGRHAVRLRHRWLSPTGEVVVSEDGASPLPFDFEPGDVAGWNHSVKAPPAPGDYVLELDLAQEGVARFGERGSEPLRRAVRVRE